MKIQRRTFLRKTSTTAAAFVVFPSAIPSYGSNKNPASTKHILKKLSKINDAQIKNILKKQIHKPGDRWNGGVINTYDIPNVHSTNDFIVQLGGAYACPFSKYHLSAKLEKPLERAINCILNVQHEDGTIDLYSTNFHSTPDTAFIVNYLSPVYIVLKRLNREGLAGFIDKMEEFLYNTGKCLAVGGIHTPNHRWVVCSALARINSFFPKPSYINRINEWLSEGIDQDTDGQYTERSVSVYSPTCNDMFLTVGRLLKRPELLDVVRKNLNMTLFYIQPGAEVLTDASKRQDQAQIGYVNGYYYTYRYFAITDKDPVFAAVCNLIENKMPEKLTRFMALILEDPVFDREMPAPGKIPDNYFRRFEHSGIFRIRRGNIDVSVIEQNPTFLSFMKGRAVLQSLRLHASFFGTRGQFIAERAELDGEKTILKMSKVHGYFQPFPKDRRIDDGNWDKMPRFGRKMSEVQTLNYTVSITESNGKVSVEMEIEGTPHVPVSLEISFRADGELHGVVPDKHTKDSYFLENGIGKYKCENDVITFGPGAAAHKWAQMRGMPPKQNGKSVYITGYTPFRHTIELR